MFTADLTSPPPIALGPVAESLAVDIRESHSTSGLSSFTYRSEGVVATNTRLNARRRRFALAHALGHLVLHERDLTVCYSMRVDDQTHISSVAPIASEADAHKFALALLMPERWVRGLVAALGEQKPTREALMRHVSDSFDTHPMAVSARLYGLGILTS